MVKSFHSVFCTLGPECESGCCAKSFEILSCIGPDEWKGIWPFRMSHQAQNWGGDCSTCPNPARLLTQTQQSESVSL